MSADRRERLLREAEAEMRRTLPRPAKRAKTEEGGASSDNQEPPSDFQGVGRRDYQAPEALASEDGLTGFLLTAVMKREMSAAKEALALLEATLPADGPRPAFAAVKMAGRGVAMLRHVNASEAPADLVALLSGVVAAIEGGAKRPQHCVRLQPVQATCAAAAGALARTAERLADATAAQLSRGRAAAAEAVGAAEDTGAVGAAEDAEAGMAEAVGTKRAAAAAAGPRQLSFAIAYRSRGDPQQRQQLQGGGGAPPLGRGAAIAELAAAYSAALAEHHSIEASVNLGAPDFVLCVEGLPVAGARGGAGGYLALCALPAALCVLKPKLSVKPLGAVPQCNKKA